MQPHHDIRGRLSLVAAAEGTACCQGAYEQDDGCEASGASTACSQKCLRHDGCTQIDAVARQGVHIEVLKLQALQILFFNACSRVGGTVVALILVVVVNDLVHDSCPINFVYHVRRVLGSAFNTICMKCVSEIVQHQFVLGNLDASACGAYECRYLRGMCTARSTATEGFIITI